MARATRSGAQFSPYELDNLVVNGGRCKVIRTGASLDSLLAEAMAAAEAREARLDADADGGGHANDDGEWENVDLHSQPPSPLSSTASSPLSSTSTSRSASPSPSPTASSWRPRPPPTASSSRTHPPPTASSSRTRPPPTASSSRMRPPPTVSSSRTRPPPTASPSSSARACGAEAQRRRQGAAARRRRRHKDSPPKTPYDYLPDTRYSQAYREDSPHSVPFDAAEFPKSGGGAWIGRRSRCSRRFYTLPELEEEGYEYVEWNGRDPKLILDSEGRIIAILLGTPDDPDWADVIEDAMYELKRARRYAKRHGLWSRQPHRRGLYFAVTAGVSFGGGQRRPGNLRNNRRMRRLLRRLLRRKSIRRIMGFQSAGFATYSPKLFKYYCRILKALFERHPDLIQLFSNSIFPSATFNCGPDAFTFDHCDIQNLAHGFCGVTSGGNFNHRRGGHLYLKQLHLVIEFPSGASMLIPSGCVNHGNTPIAEGETRHSITQYAAGGLFRWAAYGYQTVKSLVATEGGRQAKERFDGVPGARWSWAMGLFSKVDELEADRAAAFSVDA